MKLKNALKATGASLVRTDVSESKLKRFPFRTVDSARLSDIEVADLRGEASLLRVKALGPMLGQVEADKAAVAAMKRSAVLLGKAASIVSRGSRLRSSPIGSPIQWGWNLDPGTNVFGIPYNGERQGPTKGPGTTAKANRNTGEMTVSVSYDEDFSGTRSAEASIQLALATSKSGIVSLRPYIQFDAFSLVQGQHLSAYSRGVIFLSAAKWFDPSTATGSEAVLFSHQTQSDLDYLTPNGAISSSDLSLNVPISAGEPLIISIGARVTGNQSGEHYMGLPFFAQSYSYFKSQIWAKVPFLVAKLN